MSAKQQLQRSAVRQFGRPTGVAGHVAGWVMGRRPSNVIRNRWAVDLLDPRPHERILELGCGPGVALAALANRVQQGCVVGVDASAVMTRQAVRRNAAAVEAGRVRLLEGPVEQVLGRLAADEPESFDAALAVNTVGFWTDATQRLVELRGVLVPGGRVALVAQPRCAGASAATTATAGDELERLFERAGYDVAQVDTIDLTPPAVWVGARRPG